MEEEAAVEEESKDEGRESAEVEGVKGLGKRLRLSVMLEWSSGFLKSVQMDTL